MLKVSVHAPAAVGPRERMFCARTVLEVRYIALALDIGSTLDLIRRFPQRSKINGEQPKPHDSYTT